MNFDEWYEKSLAQDYGQTKEGWEACKQEILKILNRKNTDCETVRYTLEKAGILKEIEDL